jgi:hypothetical protein
MDENQVFLCRCVNQFQLVLYQLANPSIIQISELNEKATVFKHAFAPGMEARISDHSRPDAVGSYVRGDQITLLFSTNFSEVFTPQLYVNIAIMVLFFERLYQYKKSNALILRSLVIQWEKEIYTSQTISELNRFLSLNALTNEPGEIFDTFEKFVEKNRFGLTLQSLLQLPISTR